MKIARLNNEYVEVDEKNMYMDKPNEKIHLIKFCFDNPTEEKIKNVTRKFDNTNRFIIDNNIKFYNNILKTLNKKYYIENNGTQKIVSFFKKNNKVLLNLMLLTSSEYKYVIDNIDDILYNVEVMKMNKSMLDKLKEKIEDFGWNGNIII